MNSSDTLVAVLIIVTAVSFVWDLTWNLFLRRFLRDRRITELLAANNREVERRRAAERLASEMQISSLCQGIHWTC